MKFLIIGETCSDRWVSCFVGRLSPEAPCCVANPIKLTENFGMAANVRSNLKSLGASETVLLSQEHDIIKTRYVEEQSGYTLLRVDENDKASRVEKSRLETALEEDFHAILISDYNKGFLHEDDIAHIAACAKSKNIPTFLDTKKVLDVYSRDITFVKINKKEYELQKATVGRPLDFCQNLVVTLGNQGCWWVNEGVTVPVNQIAVSQLSGAGDTFLAAFALGYVKHCGFFGKAGVVKALEFANKAARIAVSKHGVVAVKAEEAE